MVMITENGGLGFFLVWGLGFFWFFVLRWITHIFTLDYRRQISHPMWIKEQSAQE